MCVVLLVLYYFVCLVNACGCGYIVFECERVGIVREGLCEHV